MGEVKISLKIVIISLEEVVVISFSKEEVLRFLSKVASSCRTKTKGLNSIIRLGSSMIFP